MNLDSLQSTIKARHTLKVLGDPEHPWEAPGPESRARLAELLEAASCAPFHFPADTLHRDEPLTSPVPWRFHLFDGQNCRRLLGRLQAEQIESGNIAKMLATADAMAVVTWLPDPHDPPLEIQQFAPTQRNMEHIAAASAATQNLLLLATAAGWNSYWSSGGVLRSLQVYEWTAIDPREVLLGGVFLFPTDTQSVPTKPGANRGKQGPVSAWSRWVSMD
ncbi:nitroreductase family protein [Aeoliella sp.]|uniref:nitroreductase family protein n=1 Tax=Aeoliella sp. TaxID=2795800 RepID=UPI003CCB9BD7